MKKLLFLGVAVIVASANMIQKYNVDLDFRANNNVLNKVAVLNKIVKNNSKCNISENISYTKSDKYPYEVELSLSCDMKDNKDIDYIKNYIKKLVSSDDVKVIKYATQTFQVSEEKYKNEKEFYEKHKDVVEAIRKLYIIQNKMQQQIEKEFEEMQKLFE